MVLILCTKIINNYVFIYYVNMMNTVNVML